MIDYNNYDYILTLDRINEDQDLRSIGRNQIGVDYNPTGSYIGVRDPKLMQSWSFGKQLQRDLGSIGSGFSCQVFDVGGEVSVTVTYSNVVTGKSGSKSFIIVFDNRNGDGTIKSSSTRWRSISGASQAVSYIRSVANSLQSFVNSGN